jgi:hypothetical protein
VIFVPIAGPNRRRRRSLSTSRVFECSFAKLQWLRLSSCNCRSAFFDIVALELFNLSLHSLYICAQ